MKRFYSLLIMAGTISVLFASCLKDDPITDYSDKAIKPIVLVPNGNWPRTQTITPLALDFTTTPYELRVYARVSWDKPLNKSVEVTFKEDQAAISEYNLKFSSNWEKINASAISIPSLKVTIPAGQQEAYIPVKIFPDKVDLNKNNMVAFTITDAGGETVASNYQTFILPLLIKNIYDADYTATGYFFHPSAPRSIDGEKHLFTVTDVTCEVELGDLGGLNYYYRFNVSGANLTNFVATGSCPPAPASGFMTADNPGNIAYPGPAFPGTAPWVHSTYNNTYNASTKTFYIHTGYGSGATSQNQFSRQQYEKWVRK